MLPKAMTDLSGRYDADGQAFYITSANYTRDELEFNMVREIPGYNDDDDIIKTWTVHTSKHRKSKISFDISPDIKMSNDHPLLWEFADMQCDLYFTGDCKDPAMLFYHLYQAHKKLYSEYEAFNISFGDDTNISERFKYLNGLLTQGPKKLMTIYAECLRRNGLSHTIINEHRAMYWNGTETVPESTKLKVLLLKSGYIIAEDFEFTEKH